MQGDGLIQHGDYGMLCGLLVWGCLSQLDDCEVSYLHLWVDLCWVVLSWGNLIPLAATSYPTIATNVLFCATSVMNRGLGSGPMNLRVPDLSQN